ncbi:MAG: hypothetical protein PHO67_08795 [Candidatus Omnitrophica bacterium]|nr:hypothetical protein [Candidatus Omnitrophota bacterium]
MKIPATLVLLGEPIEIETESGVYKFRKNAFYLATDSSGKELWILPMPKGVKEAESVPNRAASMFKRFVGWEPDRAFRFTVRDFSPNHAEYAFSIAYRSSKWTGKATGYVHDFENPTKVQMDNKKSPGICRLTGRKLTVKAVGITG